MITRTAAALAALVLPMTAMSVMAPATASGGGAEVRTHGRCSGSAHWKLKAKPDDGRLEVEGEIDSNVAGQLWRWTLKHDGRVSVRGSKRTAGRSGSFSVERRMPNRAGHDHLVFRARHGSQTCRGTITL